MTELIAEMPLTKIAGKLNMNVKKPTGWGFADSPEYFKLVFDREVEKAKPKGINHFKNAFISLLNEIVSDYETLLTPTEQLQSIDVKTRYIDFKNWLEKYAVDGEKADQSKENNITPYYDAIFSTLIEDAETSFFGGRNYEDVPLIHLAAFVELMYDARWLGVKKHRAAQCKRFSIEKYKVDLGISIESSKSKDRKQHKNRIKHHLKLTKRGTI